MGNPLWEQKAFHASCSMILGDSHHWIPVHVPGAWLRNCISSSTPCCLQSHRVLPPSLCLAPLPHTLVLGHCSSHSPPQWHPNQLCCSHHIWWGFLSLWVGVREEALVIFRADAVVHLVSLLEIKRGVTTCTGWLNLIPHTPSKMRKKD